MKNLVVWIVTGIVVATSAATGIHLRSIKESREKVSRLQPLYERTAVFPELKLAMEKYRRASGNFRKMYNPQIAASKSAFRNDMAKDLSRLNALAPTEADQTLGRQINDEVDSLLSLSAKYEPQLFLKDAYQKPDVQDLHEQILKDITQLQNGTEHRLESLQTSTSEEGDRSLRLIIAAQLAILALVCLLIARTYVMLIRPAKKLAQYAKNVADSHGKIEIPAHLPRRQRDVAVVLAGIAGQAEQLRDQRRKFIEDVIEDIRPGLAALKRSQDHEEAVTILSASLEDLKQLAEISRMDQRMNPGVVDLSELVTDTCKRAASAGLCPEVQIAVPGLPTWVSMDAAKVERAMIQILSRMGEMLEKGQTLEASLNVRGKSGLNGVEVSFYSTGNRVPGAPEQEITRHWIAQKGLALTLAQKVAKAHGGSIFAAGLMGSPVQISIKFPRSILTDGLVSPATYTPSRPLTDLENFNTT